MFGVNAPTQSNGENGGPVYAGVAARRAASAEPGAQSMSDDSAFLQSIVGSLGRSPDVSQTLQESYYKFLPPLTRGHVVGNGYPSQNGGLLNPDAFFPRIVPMQVGDPAGI